WTSPAERTRWDGRRFAAPSPRRRGPPDARVAVPSVAPGPVRSAIPDRGTGPFRVRRPARSTRIGFPPPRTLHDSAVPGEFPTTWAATHRRGIAAPARPRAPAR